MDPENLVDRLRDIRGLDPVPWWPPGPGWWLVAIALGLLVAVMANWRPLATPRLARRGIFWQGDATRQLRALRQRLGTAPAKELTSEFSELLRRVAMARCGRGSCAGLSGRSWLSWLRDHDPAGFDWTGYADVLLQAPYAPPGTTINDATLQRLIDAALVWTRRSVAECAAEETRDAV
jgi:hypothetical protein